MDIVTQGLAGAVVAQSAASRAPARTVIALGAFAGLLADADVLIRSADDPLVTLEFHRHFTHALLFVPLGGLLAAVLAWPFVRRHLRFPAAYGLATLGYLPSGLLDACTSYGTHLLWPFSDARVAWNLIAVVDPAFSLILLGAIVVAFVRRRAAPARVGLALALAYLAAGGLQRERAEAIARALAHERGHVLTRLEVKPTLGNLVLWRSIYQTGDRFVVDAVRVGVAGSPAVYPGESLVRFTPAQLPDLPADSVLAGDIARFTRFSDGYVAVHPRMPGVLGDVRYALLPTSGVPLWGIELHLAEPDRHAVFRSFRQIDAATRREFLAMLRGRRLDR